MSMPIRTAASSIPSDLSREQLLEIYYYLRLTRSLEERLVRLQRQGKVIGGLYRSLGQEGESVGSAFALGPGDILSPLIRNLGSMLLRGAQPVDVFRQYMAKRQSPTGGRELNIHFDDLELGYLGPVSPLGDMVAVMAGIALSFKIRRVRRVGMVYVGDGCTSTGTFHEAVNLAAVQRLPLVVVLESNGYAYSTPTVRQTAVTHLADKGKAYGIPSVTVDGNDVFAVYEAARTAVRRARAGEGVTFLEVETYRRKGHAEHDDQRYQPRDEIAQWERKDPIVRYVARVTGDGWVESAELAEVDTRVDRELNAAVEACEGEPLPEGGSALSAVYRDPPSADSLWFRGL